MTVSLKPIVFFFLLSTLFFAITQQVSISLNTTTLSKSGDSVLIQWSGVDNPSKLDWLGIYSPPSSDHHNFVGYVFLSKSPSWESGWGNISIPLVNLRSNYSFRIFRWTESEINPKKREHDQNPLPGTKHPLASSQVLGFQQGRGPEQIHLAYTDREDEMRVMFVTEDGGERRARYGKREGELGNVAVARVGRYEREDMFDSPAKESVGWRDPGFIHDGVMKNLKKGVKYYYQVKARAKWTRPEMESFGAECT